MEKRTDKLALPMNNSSNHTTGSSGDEVRKKDCHEANLATLDARLVQRMICVLGQTRAAGVGGGRVFRAESVIPNGNLGCT